MDNSNSAEIKRNLVVEPLNAQAMTESGLVGVVMLVHPQQGEDCQFFEYNISGPFGPKDRIEWDKNTAMAVFPAALAKMLVSSKWARAMNEKEVRAYNKEKAND